MASVEEAHKEFSFLTKPGASWVEEPDKETIGEATTVVEAPQEPKGMPAWASKGALNFRGLTELSPAHYSTICEIGAGVVDVMLDTAGARSMIDLETATKLRLPVERVSSTKYFGSFYSASGVPTPYAGRVRGPTSRSSSTATWAGPPLAWEAY